MRPLLCLLLVACSSDGPNPDASQQGTLVPLIVSWNFNPSADCASAGVEYVKVTAFRGPTELESEPFETGAIGPCSASNPQELLVLPDLNYDVEVMACDGFSCETRYDRVIKSVYVEAPVTEYTATFSL